MQTFNALDPFPVVAIEEYSYLEAKAHAESADLWLGFEMEKVEQQILASNKAQQNWSGLPLGSLMTPYIELRLILSLLDFKNGESFTDLGCAYARMAHVLQYHYPQSPYFGFELELLRVIEANRRLDLYQNRKLMVSCQDLGDLNFQLPQADIYFIYDFGSLPDIRKTLEDLRLKAKREKIRVVARGRSIRQEILTKHPWLGEVVPPRHYSYFSFFYSA